MAYFYLPITILSWLAVILNKPLKLNLTTPDSTQIWILLAIGFTLFAADYCLFRCYKEGGSVAGITILTGTLFPVFASLINVSTGGNWPRWNEVVGYFLAAIAVAFVCIGEKH
jgi:drug/metabolite transporter (DMT)-like permease